MREVGTLVAICVLVSGNNSNNSPASIDICKFKKKLEINYCIILLFVLPRYETLT